MTNCLNKQKLLCCPGREIEREMDRKRVIRVQTGPSGRYLEWHCCLALCLSVCVHLSPSQEITPWQDKKSKSSRNWSTNICLKRPSISQSTKAVSLKVKWVASVVFYRPLFAQEDFDNSHTQQLDELLMLKSSLENVINLSQSMAAGHTRRRDETRWALSTLNPSNKSWIYIANK